MASPNTGELTRQTKQWATELGFQQAGIADTHLDPYETQLEEWLKRGFHADMYYMMRHGRKRTQPAELIPGTIRIISVRMNYLARAELIGQTLADGQSAYVARYALGRDYHKVIRNRLKQLALRIEGALPDSQKFAARVFTDSAPVMEKPIAEKAGLGWIGKNTLLINEQAGSWFFLGEIYTNLPLVADTEQAVNRCGSCSACLEVCPTDAIVAPYQLDARRCISYQTIENRGSIPVELRAPIGNRVFGCDDCQMVCPWNRYAQHTTEQDFSPRNNLDTASLLDLYDWTETEFDERTRGSAIRRTGYEGWVRNLSIALGNAPSSPGVVAALRARLKNAAPMLREHIEWALAQQGQDASGSVPPEQNQPPPQSFTF